MRNVAPLAALLLCTTVPAAAAAQAQPPPGAASSDDKKEASAAFAAGQRAFEQSDYAAALESFERAFALAAHDAIRFNIAVCLERLGRYREALVQYETAAKSQTLGEAERERARLAADAVRLRFGTLVVPADAGGSARVDGGGPCATPCRILLDPGPHEVVLQQETGERRVSVALERGRELVLLPAPRPAPTPAAPAPAPDRPSGPGWLTVGGAALAAIGTAGIVGFGLDAQSLHDDYLRAPSQSTLDDGVRARSLANVSIGVAAVGAALVAIDLFFLARRPARRAAAPGRTSL